MYEPDYNPPYLALVIFTILTIVQCYSNYKDCRLRSLYGDGYESMVRVIDEVKENYQIRK